MGAACCRGRASPSGSTCNRLELCPVAYNIWSCTRTTEFGCDWNVILGRVWTECEGRRYDMLAAVCGGSRCPWRSAVPGHWEGDLIGGSKNSYIATLVERHSRYVMLVKVTNKDTESVVSALIKQSQRLPGELYRSLTWDRGKELADGTDLSLHSQAKLSAIARQLNER